MDKPLTRAQKILFQEYADRAEEWIKYFDQARLTPELFPAFDIAYAKAKYSELMDKIYDLESTTGHPLNEKYERNSYANQNKVPALPTRWVEESIDQKAEG